MVLGARVLLCSLSAPPFSSSLRIRAPAFSWSPFHQQEWVLSLRVNPRGLPPLVLPLGALPRRLPLVACPSAVTESVVAFVHYVREAWLLTWGHRPLLHAPEKGPLLGSHLHRLPTSPAQLNRSWRTHSPNHSPGEGRGSFT